MGSITLAGLGPGGAGQILLETLAAMKNADKVLLRTAVHPSVCELKEHGIDFISLDDCYSNETFEKVYNAITDICIKEAKNKNIVYAVPGSPLVAERTVVILCEKAKAENIPVKILPALGFLDAVFAALMLDPVEGLAIIDALDPDSVMNAGNMPLLVTQVHSRDVASDLKLSLMEKYPDDFTVKYLHHLGMDDELVMDIPLFELDRQKNIDHLTTIYVPLPKSSGQIDTKPLQNVLARLRQPDGCPWDREQTHKTLRQYVIEEAYEVVEAIDENDDKALCDELGDLLLQVVFHARIAEEENRFAMQDVVENVVEKMYRRHPHVFGTIHIDDAETVIENWEAIKKKEYSSRKKILDGIPAGLPALMKAYKLQSKAAKVGFDWTDINDVWKKVFEEIDELKEAAAEKNEKNIQHEFGDILFSLANLSRHFKLNPEIALLGANERFKKRFAYVEQEVEKSGKNWDDFTLAELDSFWDQAKKEKF